MVANGSESGALDARSLRRELHGPVVDAASAVSAASSLTTNTAAMPIISLSRAPEPVLVSGARSRRFDRDDIVVRKGEMSLVSGHFTPAESMVEDLLAVREALERAGVDFLLVRGDSGRPVIAVEHRRRNQVSDVLAESFANEPFYLRPVHIKKSGAIGKPGLPALLADGALASHEDDAVFRIYRPRIEPIGRLRYGADTAFQLELWRFGDDEIQAPVPNALMRRRLPRSEARETTVELYNRSWRTLQNMFDDLASDITFDIDMVFSWVDGSSAEYQAERARQMEGQVVGEGDDSEARYRQIDELKFALRSVYLFAPWVRRIFVATDSPAPSWLVEHPRVTIMRSEDFFADTSTLPTHNSHAVESQLHHIPGLAEHFLYSNDDMFFGRPVGPEMFFSPGGVTKFIEASTRIGLGENHPARSGFENAARVNRALLLERFGKVTTRHLEHTAAPLRKSILFEMEREFPEDFARTAGSRFRSSTDISVTNSLYHYYALMTGRAVAQTRARVRYIETTLRSALRQMKRLGKRRDQDMFCLNDGSFPEIPDDVRREAVTTFLQRYFPFPAPWEREYQEQRATRGDASVVPLRVP